MEQDFTYFHTDAELVPQLGRKLASSTWSADIRAFLGNSKAVVALLPRNHFPYNFKSTSGSKAHFTTFSWLTAQK